MSAKFLESVGSKLAEQWVATLLTPAFMFWCGGAIAAIKHFGWHSINSWFVQQSEAPSTIVLLAGVFSLIAVSAFVVQRFDVSVLRFLKGYWSPLLFFLRPLRQWLVKRNVQQGKRIGDRWQRLKQLPLHQLTPALHAEFSQLDWKQQHLPLPNNIMPTRLGNLLISAEGHSLERYGLDFAVCWSRLWLLLPEGVKKEFQAARAELNVAARVWLWCLLFMGWGFWVWWLAPLGLLAAFFTYYYWAIPAAFNYGELIRASFDLYRVLLYDGLRWILPEDPNEERKVGEDLSSYLWRGL